MTAGLRVDTYLIPVERRRPAHAVDTSTASKANPKSLMIHRVGDKTALGKEENSEKKNEQSNCMWIYIL